MYDAVFAERLNKPAVVLCNADFARDAISAASGKGMPGVRSLVETVPCECTVQEQIVPGVRAVIEDAIAALTRPLTEEERVPTPKEVEQPRRVAFAGSLEEVNRFFYKRGWADGFPIIPPTEEAVREMLTGTDLPPDHVVAKIIPRMGKATVEKIAINAVMAGALPTYMPVLIAGVQALMDPNSKFGTWEVSTGSWVPFWILSGPIRNQLHVNSGSGALSPGDIANAAIGRAMGLIVKNIGGARKGIEDMGVLGNPGKYSMVIAENEEASPWEPLHVEQGFERDDSCVTVTFPNSFAQVWPYGTDDKGILRSAIANILPVMRAIIWVLTPPFANSLAQAGWTKKAALSYVADYVRVPGYRHPNYWGFMGPEAERDPLPVNDADPTPVVNARQSRIIVAGGPGAFMGLFGSGGARVQITKRVELPAKWDALVKKYKDVVPTYARY